MAAGAVLERDYVAGPELGIPVHKHPVAKAAVQEAILMAGQRAPLLRVI